MTKEQKIAAILLALSSDVVLLSLIRHLITQGIQSVDETKLDEILVKLNEEH